MRHLGLNRSLISKLFRLVTSPNKCEHDKGRNGRRSRKDKKKYPLSFIGCNPREKDAAPYLPTSLMARFLEAARSTTKDCKKEMERGLIPVVSLH